MDSRFIRMDDTVAAFARASSSSVIWPEATEAISCAITFTMSPARSPSATPEMPTTPTSSNTEWNAVQFCAHACLFRTRVYRREYMPFPGPPALKEPPPPISVFNTVIAVDAFVSFHPPANSNASTTFATGESDATR